MTIMPINPKAKNGKVIGAEEVGFGRKIDTNVSNANTTKAATATTTVIMAYKMFLKIAGSLK